MEDDCLKEKEYYKGRIIDLINSIERIDMLIFLNRFISNVIKAGF